jgi:hypothetical protein
MLPNQCRHNERARPRATARGTVSTSTRAAYGRRATGPSRSLSSFVNSVHFRSVPPVLVSASAGQSCLRHVHASASSERASARAALVSARAVQWSSSPGPIAFSPAHRSVQPGPTGTGAERSSVHSVPTSFPREQSGTRAGQSSPSPGRSSLSPGHAPVSPEQPSVRAVLITIPAGHVADWVGAGWIGMNQDETDRTSKGIGTNCLVTRVDWALAERTKTRDPI